MYRGSHVYFTSSLLSKLLYGRSSFRTNISTKTCSLEWNLFEIVATIAIITAFVFSHDMQSLIPFHLDTYITLTKVRKLCTKTNNCTNLDVANLFKSRMYRILFNNLNYKYKYSKNFANIKKKQCDLFTNIWFCKDLFYED